MPLMKAAVSGDSYRLAISSASLMAAPAGTSGRYRISYMATRITAAAIREIREKDQPTAYLAI